VGPKVIVVDTNVVAYFVIAGTLTVEAEALRSRDRDWRAPALLRSEWLNVCVHHIRQGMFDRDQAIRSFRRGLSLVTISEEFPDPLQIMNLHLVGGCSSYDCQFVALAEKLNVQMATWDQEIIRAHPGTAFNPTTI
jgi:predicted nucleic acid-binding protein